MSCTFLKRQRNKSRSRLQYLKVEPWDTWADLGIKDEVNGTAPDDARIFDIFDSALDFAGCSSMAYSYIVTPVGMAGDAGRTMTDERKEELAAQLRAALATDEADLARAKARQLSV